MTTLLREALFTLRLAKQNLGNPVLLLLLPKSNHFLRGGSEGVDRPGAPWWFGAWFWSCFKNDSPINRLAIDASIIGSPLFERLFWSFFRNLLKNETWEPSGRLGNLWRATTSHQIQMICWNESWLFQRVYWPQITKCRRNPIQMEFLTNVDSIFHA